MPHNLHETEYLHPDARPAESATARIHIAWRSEHSEHLHRAGLGLERLDRGIWLLGGRARRHQEWSRLREESKPIHAIHHLALYDALKRTLDVTASIFLLILFAPLLAGVAILIKLDSDGPAIFRQTRIGRHGRPFVLWKFRSMRSCVNGYAASPNSPTDARITRLGRLLRRTSLDELPQLLNVVKGEMSLIGPRPEMPFIVDSYSVVERQRLSITPGMTGLWQISPGRIAPIHDNLQFDLHYIRHRNLALDAVILMRTLSVILRGTDNA